MAGRSWKCFFVSVIFRKIKVKERLERDDADISELDRIDEQIAHYEVLLHGVPVSPKNYILED